MKGLKSFIFSEKRLAGAIFGILAVTALSFVFGPNIYAQFARQTGSTGWGYGYGYGYGKGYGFDGGTYAGYRIDGGNLPNFGYGFGYGNIDAGVTYDATNGYSVAPADIASLVQSGVLVPNGGSIASTTKVTFDSKVTIDLAPGTTITIPSGTTFTSDAPGNFSALAAANGIDTTGLTGATSVGALSFGLPSLGLTVNPAITIAINVGTGHEGQILSIYRKDATGAWVNGPSGTYPICTVTASICSFTTTHLSSFAVASNASNGTNGATGASAGSGGGAYTPVSAPSSDSTVTGTYDANTAKANNPDFNTDKGLVAAATPTACVSGSLIKSASLSAVYYCGKDGKRYVFVNDKAYFSWYPDFSTVQIVSNDTLASITIGGNITYRPGSRMIKIQSDPKVYAIARGGTLRWVATEAIAARLYGANWNQKIDDVSDAFFVNYVLGSSIAQ